MFTQQYDLCDRRIDDFALRQLICCEMRTGSYKDSVVIRDINPIILTLQDGVNPFNDSNIAMCLFCTGNLHFDSSCDMVSIAVSDLRAKYGKVLMRSNIFKNLFHVDHSTVNSGGYKAIHPAFEGLMLLLLLRGADGKCDAIRLDDNKKQIIIDIKAQNQVVAIGKVRMYGYCDAIKSNGEPCKIAVDKSKGCCQYHCNKNVKIATADYKENIAKAAALSMPITSVSGNPIYRSNEIADSSSYSTSKFLSNKKEVSAAECKKLTSLASQSTLPSSSSIQKQPISNDLLDNILNNRITKKKIDRPINIAPDYDDNSEIQDSSDSRFGGSLSVFEFSAMQHLQKTATTGNSTGNNGSRIIFGPASSKTPSGEVKINSSAGHENSLLRSGSYIPDHYKMVGSVFIDTKKLLVNASNKAAVQNSSVKINGQHISIIKPSISSEADAKAKADAKKAKEDLMIKRNQDLDKLLNRKPIHAENVDIEWNENYNKRIDKMISKEKAEDKLTKSHMFAVKNGVKCLVCNNYAENVLLLCQQGNHAVVKVKLWKRFYECGNCFVRTHVLCTSGVDSPYEDKINAPKLRCESCHSFDWHACGSQGSVDAKISRADRKDDNRLILSASEWTTRKDFDSMAARVSNL